MILASMSATPVGGTQSLAPSTKPVANDASPNIEVFADTYIA